MYHNLGIRIGAPNGAAVGGVVTSVAPSFNAAALVVGATLSSAYVAGSYSSPLGTITEDTFSYDVDGVSQAGSYVLVAGDRYVSVPNIPLLINAAPSIYSSAVDPVLVTNTAPEGATGSTTIIVAAGTSTAPAQMGAPTLASTATRITATKASDPSDGGSAITSYDLRYSTDGGSGWTTVTGFTSPHVITALTPGATAILVQERAVNAVGAGSWSTSASIDMKVPTLLGIVKLGGTGATIDLDLTTLDTTNGGIGGALAENDVGIAINGWATSATDVNPVVNSSGWTEVFEDFQTDTRASNVAVSWKAMGSTPDTALQTNASNAAGSGSCSYVEFWRYIDPTDPFDIDVTGAKGADSALGDPPSITPTVAGAKVIAFCAATGDTTPATMTAPSGMTLTGIITNGGSSRGFRIASARYDWTSGAYDPAAFGSGESATSDAWIAGSFALKPW